MSYFDCWLCPIGHEHWLENLSKGQNLRNLWFLPGALWALRAIFILIRSICLLLVLRFYLRAPLNSHLTF